MSARCELTRGPRYTGAGNKYLSFRGRAINVRSEGGPANCNIDCEHDGRGVNFHSGETADAVLEGFTIRNGEVATNGGAILCESASPTVLNCVLSNNQAFRGGGLYSLRSNPIISNCTFSGNSAGNVGGGMYNIERDPTVTNCAFTDNTGDFGGGVQSVIVGLLNSGCGRADCSFLECLFH